MPDFAFSKPLLASGLSDRIAGFLYLQGLITTDQIDRRQ
jgi:hypothetical protein